MEAEDLCNFLASFLDQQKPVVNGIVIGASAHALSLIQVILYRSFLFQVFEGYNLGPCFDSFQLRRFDKVRLGRRRSPFLYDDTNGHWFHALRALRFP